MGTSLFKNGLNKSNFEATHILMTRLPLKFSLQWQTLINYTRKEKNMNECRICVGHGNLGKYLSFSLAFSRTGKPLNKIIIRAPGKSYKSVNSSTV